MKDISYEILDLFRQYGSSPEGIRKALDSQSGPEVLHALSDIRENLLEWLDLSVHDQVLEIGSGYGAWFRLWRSDRTAGLQVRPCGSDGRSR